MTRRIELEITDDAADVVVLRAASAFSAHGQPLSVEYETRTGAILRVGGVIRGAFDRRHRAFSLSAAPGDVTLEVERRSLPASGLPPGDGLRWRWLLARAAQAPARVMGARGARKRVARRVHRSSDALALIGHSHLDVAWLWTYAEAARKALRTFATAVRQLEADDAFVFTQSQPQLYAFVRERDPALFERVRALARDGRFDTSGAALWVEPDCLLPSGESLLHQLIAGMRYIEKEFGTRPAVAWLPDSFGFPNTLPTLLAHAGVTAFATTKLGWNETTAFPYSRFRFVGPDGSTVAAANIASIEGEYAPHRVATARRRGDPLLIGYGDGGGGTPDAALAAAPRYGTWTTLGDHLARVAADPGLPRVRDELYLETHRGTATTHHDIKARNAALERALGEAELAVAWARALHASPYFLREARAQLDAAWQIVSRNQFHDVLPGTAIAEVYRDARAEYDVADALVANVHGNARSVLPVASRSSEPQQIEAEWDGDAFVFDNGIVSARVRRNGTFSALRLAGGPNLVRTAGRLALYGDRPARWDAWNVDADYRRRPRRVRTTGCAVAPGGLEIRSAFGSSRAAARVSLAKNEPFLRVDYAVLWHERHALLRVENALAFGAERARFGTPHGAVDRVPDPQTSRERAKFEACGQRYARLDGPAGGVAVLALDTYGWSTSRGARGSDLGHSLLRGPTWPDPSADAGEHAISLAYVPLGTSAGMGVLEALWTRFSGASETPMFVCDDPAIAIVATTLAGDGRSILVRVRECDGAARTVRLRCGARARGVACVDALERPVAGEATLADGAIEAAFRAYELRTFAVTLA